MAFKGSRADYMRNYRLQRRAKERKIKKKRGRKGQILEDKKLEEQRRRKNQRNEKSYYNTKVLIQNYNHPGCNRAPECNSLLPMGSTHSVDSITGKLSRQKMTENHRKKTEKR